MESSEPEMQWIECEGDEPFWAKTIHKGRIVGKPFKAHTIQNMVHTRLRDDDVLICSYPKSGVHWLWDNTRMLLSGEVKSDSVEKEEMFMEYHDHGHFDDLPSPRIFNNHIYFDDQPSDLLKGKTKLILLYRNPKDVCVSFYHHHTRIPSYKYNGKFSNYIQRFVQGKVSSSSCFKYWKMWEEGLKNHPNIPYILVRYEDLHKYPIAERRRIASFLCRDDLDDSFLQEVTNVTSIDSMRELKNTVALKDTIGEPILYRKGKVGDWKNHFTVSQSEWFDGIVEKEMGQSDMFKFVYSID